MSEKLICILIASLAIIGLLISIPFRRRALKKKASSRSFQTMTRKPWSAIGILLLSSSILLIDAKQDYSLLMNGVLCCVSILASFISSRELTFIGFEGLYDDYLVGNATMLPLSQIEEIPETNASENDRKYFALDSVLIKTKNGKTLIFPCTDESEKKELISKLQEKLVLKKNS